MSGVVLPVFVPASCLGRSDRLPPSERVLVGYIGTGPRGVHNLQEMLLCPEAQVVAVCDVWGNRRQQAKALVDRHYQSMDCRAYEDFREILGREDIQAVSIATCDHWHVPVAIAAMRAGKDVSVEKPLGVSIAEDLMCRETVHRHQRVFQYGTEARSFEACRLGCQLIRNGKIGEIRQILVKAPDSVPGGSREPKPIPQDLNYELWLGPAPWRPYSGCPDSGPGWYHVYDYALGFIAGWGAHPLDVLIWAYDLPRNGIWEIEGRGFVPQQGAHDVVMRWDCQIRFPTGSTLEYFAHGVPRDELPELKQIENYALFIGSEGWVAVYYGGMLCQPESLKTIPPGAMEVQLPLSTGQERNFLECVLSREQPVSSIGDAVQSDLISHLCELAVRLGRKLRWDPNGERFVDDPEAQRLSRRSQREPWTMV